MKIEAAAATGTSNSKFNGIGYQEARKKRFDEGFSGSGANGLESRGNEEFIIYFGRACVNDFETKVPARGLLKIGRGKWKTALQRGRNQPGIDFRIYAEILLYTNEDTHTVEKLITKTFKNRNVKGSQGQKELYNFTDVEIVDLVYTTEEIINDFTDVKIKEVNFYK
tara:strand:+ start:367 stop:867 length:501 start_codon:yes stop_codon:yes gene_type:complete